MWRLHDLSGQQFGRLTVLHLSGRDRQNKPVWKCQCACGKEVDVRAKSLKAGHIQSCGCFAMEVRRRAVITAIGAIRLPFGVSAVRCILARYKREAAKKGLAWDLSEEAAVNLMKQPCFYCGIEPRQRAVANKGFGFFIYNGIDRLDPKAGYTIANCKPCCKTCNFAKLRMTYDEFCAWLERAYSYHFGRRHRDCA